MEMEMKMEKKGYTETPNELLERTYNSGFNSTQKDIILYILRMTLGWHKREDVISINQIVQVTGKSYQIIQRGLKQLRKWRVIDICTNGIGKALTLRINFDYSQWDTPLNKSLEVKNNLEGDINESLDPPLKKSLDLLLNKSLDTKETIKEMNKETTTKENVVVILKTIEEKIRKSVSEKDKEALLGFIKQLGFENVFYQAKHISEEVRNPIGWLKTALEREYQHPVTDEELEELEKAKRDEEKEFRKMNGGSPCCGANFIKRDGKSYCANCDYRIVKDENGFFVKTEEKYGDD